MPPRRGYIDLQSIFIGLAAYAVKYCPSRACIKHSQFYNGIFKLLLSGKTFFANIKLGLIPFVGFSPL